MATQTTNPQAPRWRIDQCTDDPRVYWLMHDGIGVGKLFDNAYVTSPQQIVAALNADEELRALGRRRLAKVSP